MKSRDSSIDSADIRTFEEHLLTAEERAETKKQREEDQESAAYYRNVFQDPDSAFVTNDVSEEDIPEDESYIWGEDI